MDRRRGLGIMCFNPQARPQSTILKSLKEDLESMMQEWYMSDTAPRVKLAPKLIEKSQHA